MYKSLVSLAALTALAFASAAGAQTPPASPTELCIHETHAGRFTEAKTACDAAVAAAAASPAKALQARAELAFAQRRYDDALTDLDVAIDADPRLTSALLLRGKVHEGKKSYQLALLDYETAIAMAPDNIDYLQAAASLSQSLRELDKGLGFADRILKINAKSVPALMTKGHLLRLKSDSKGSFAAFDAAVRAAPGDAQALHWRGHLNQRLGNMEAALADFTAALAIAPRSADILSDLGDTNRELKRPAEALAAYDRAVAADPTYARGLSSRGTQRFQQGDPLGARVDFENHGKLQPSDSLKDTLAIIDRSLDQTYRKPQMDARELLKAADPGGVACDSKLPGEWDYHSAVMGEGIAAGEASLRKTALTDYRACLNDARSGGAAIVTDIPQMRVKLIDLAQAQPQYTAQLQARCAQLPEARETCDNLIKRIGEDAAALKSDQKRIEAAALSQAGDVSVLEAAAPDKVEAAIVAERARFAAKARSTYAEYIDLNRLTQQASLVNTTHFRSLYDACGEIRLYAPQDDDDMDRLNGRLNDYQDCLAQLSRDSSNVGWKLYDAHRVLDEAVNYNAIFAALRCSVSASNGCIDDAQWKQVQTVATPAVRDRALSLSQAYGKVPDQTSAEQTRINDAVDRLNAEIKRHNTAVGISDALNTFANAFNAATAAQNNIYYNTSTSAMGIK
ncbi:lipopolysaccharide assembly protein LapB [Asticcacaulis sp. AND118]|uniref:tetratricopeptide repeat protein n=1 Tax=Asticcacaulis sp. AND118 TaxID=2840468 RepID=UPI001CFFE4E8|nr:tetratricopeptide repeat protein [Asticcacaulis sp. AND118]UDF02788.1 tetratricopeptide repeat protein [Asticcacaulis sp. AND118]